MIIQIINKAITQEMLRPQHHGDAGLDLRASIAEPITIARGLSHKIPSGIRTAIPEGWVGLMTPRSGKGSKGLHLGNVLGVIDATFRGEILMNVKNNSNNVSPLVINPLDRIMQLVVVPHYDYNQMLFVNDLDETSRGDSGFGDSGDA